MVSAATHKSMELEGNLSSFQLADVLRFLVMGRMSGALTLESDGREIVLLIKEGALAGTISPDHEQKLRQLLVNGGHVTRRQIDEATENRSGPRRLPALLLQKRAIDRERLAQVVALQVKEELWEAFSWSAGSFKFEHGMTSDHDDALLGLEIEPLIDESSTRMEQWHGIVQNLGQLDDVYRVNPELAGPPAAPLDKTTWRVLSLVNGRLSATGLVVLSGLGKFETLIALDRLLSQQIIEPVRGERGGKPRQKVSGLAARKESANAPAARDETAHDPSATGLRALFGRRKKTTNGAHDEAAAPKKVSAEGQTHFTTNAGYACELLNRLAGRMAEELKINGALEDVWKAEMMRRPRADLVRMEGGTLSAASYERYVTAANGIDKTLAAIHEETLEALRSAGRALVARAGEQLDAQTRAWVQETLAPCADHAEVTWPAEFPARAWAQTLINE